MLGALPDAKKYLSTVTNVLYYIDSVVWVLIRTPYKTPNKKVNWHESFPGDYLWTLGKGIFILTLREVRCFIQKPYIHS